MEEDSNMVKEMIFKISLPLQKKIMQEYAEQLSKATEVPQNEILKQIQFEQQGFLIDIDKIECTSLQKEKLKNLVTLEQKSRLLRSRDFCLEKPEKEKGVRFQREKLEQMKQRKEMKKDQELQR